MEHAETVNSNTQAEASPPAFVEKPAGKSNNKTIIIIVVVAAVLLLCCCIGVVIFLVTRPIPIMDPSTTNYTNTTINTPAVTKSNEIYARLQEEAATINKSVPVEVDSVTTLESAVATTAGDVMQYNYTVSVDISQYTDEEWNSIKLDAINGIKTRTEYQWFRENNIRFQFQYYYKYEGGSGVRIFWVNPADYNK
jgi:flagellar basal body-associated protein FliL